jgi:hypothetical protein
MLQYAYKRNAGDNSPLVRKLPIDLDGYSHQHLNALGIANGLEMNDDLFGITFLLTRRLL